MKTKKTRVVDYTTFVKRSTEAHGDTYDYTDSMYIKGVEKIRIYCKHHGYFWQRKSAHIQGIGCAGCSGRRKYDWDYFLLKARETHGLKYCYEKPSEVLGGGTLVNVICPTHGPFQQSISKHVKYGCKECGYEESAIKRRKTKEDFIRLANEIHKNKYDYSKSNYLNRQTKIEIICPEHGSFWQTPNGHIIQKSGCRKCYHCIDEDTWIERFKETHESEYIYSKFVYHGANNLSIVVCPTHGDFLVSPINHYYEETGCPHCSLERRSKGEYFTVGCGFGRSGYYGDSENLSNLYVLKVGHDFIKVGLSNNVDRRVSKIKRDLTRNDIEIIKCVEGIAPNLYDLEQEILIYSGLQRYRPETTFAGRTECLLLEDLPEVLNIIESSVNLL